MRFILFQENGGRSIAKPEDAIKCRKKAFFVMQQNFGRVAAGGGTWESCHDDFRTQ